MIVDNLFDIFDRHRTNKCSWEPDDPVVKESPSNLSGFKGVENFCFLKEQTERADEEVSRWRKEAVLIKDAFSKLLNTIELQYGSVSLVINFYSELRSDPSFRGHYPYPKEFFDAIRELQDLGAGEQEGLRLDSTSRSHKIGTVLYLAYYLSLPKEALTDEGHKLHPGKNSDLPPDCKEDAPFFNGVPATEREILKRNFCKRIENAWLELRDKPRRIPSVGACTCGIWCV